MIVEEYRMERVAQGCAGCKKKFEVAEGYFSTIVDEVACFQRRDYCESCWREDLAAAAFSFWKTRVPEEERQDRVLRLDLNLVRSFFDKLVCSPERHHREMCYVLALLLLRKRRLRFADATALKQLGFRRAEVTAIEEKAKEAAESVREGEVTTQEQDAASDSDSESVPEWDILTLVDAKTRDVFHVSVPKALPDEKLVELNDELLFLMSAPASSTSDDEGSKSD